MLYELLHLKQKNLYLQIIVQYLFEYITQVQNKINPTLYSDLLNFQLLSRGRYNIM